VEAAEALDVVQADVDLLGPVQQVRRAALAEHGHQHDQADHHDHQHHRQPEDGVGAEAEPGERVQRAAAQAAPPGQPADHRQHPGEPREPSLAAALACPADVDVGGAQHRAATEHAARARHAGSPPEVPAAAPFWQ
jgi:ABC-type nickel/cobalt efflux system permease component RcnA